MISVHDASVNKLSGKINVGRDAHIAPPATKLSEYEIISKKYIDACVGKYALCQIIFI